MIEIWEEFARFKSTNRKLADLEILEIYQQIIRKKFRLYSNTVIETLNTKKKARKKQNLPTESKRQVISNPNTTQPNTTEETQTQERKKKQCRDF